MSERSFRTNRVLPFLKSLRETAYFPIQQKTIRGDADYILCSHGFFVWLELKKNTKSKLAPLQKFKANQVLKCFGYAFRADPDNWETVKCFLIKLDRGEKPYE